MPKQREDIALSFHVRPRLLASLDAAVKAQGISRSELIRLALIQYLINEGFYPSNGQEDR